MEQSGVIIIIEILEACTRKRKIFIIIVVLIVIDCVLLAIATFD